MVTHSDVGWTLDHMLDMLELAALYLRLGRNGTPK